MYPVICSFGPVKIYSYGLMVAAAVMAVYAYALYRAEGDHLDKDIIKSLFPIALLTGLIGARFLFVVTNADYYRKNLSQIILINQGGLSIFGGFVLAFLVLACYLCFRGYDWVRYADFLTPKLFLGQAIGRIGCFLNGCCYGKTLLSAGAPGAGSEGIVIPAQLISAGLLFGIFIILEFALKEKVRKRGALTSLALGFYAVFRFGIEYLRGDNTALFMGLTLGQMISVALFAFAIVFWLLIGSGGDRKEN